eukprot:347331_1
MIITIISILLIEGRRSYKIKKTHKDSSYNSYHHQSTPSLINLCGSTEHLEIALVVDNSGGLNDEECEIQRNNIGELLKSLKNNNDDSNTLITYIEIDGEGCQNL